MANTVSSTTKVKIRQSPRIKVNVKDDGALQATPPITLKNVIGDGRSFTELVDVQVINPSNSDILAYVSNTGLWTNRAPTTFAGNTTQFVVANTSDFDYSISLSNTVTIRDAVVVGNSFSTNSLYTYVANAAIGYANIISANIGSAYIANAVIIGGTTLVHDIIPDANNIYTIGNTTNRFATLYLSGNTLYMGNVVFEDTNTALTLTTSGGAPLPLNMGNTAVNGSLSVTGAFTSESLEANTLTIHLATELQGNVAVGGNVSFTTDNTFIKFANSGSIILSTSDPAALRLPAISHTANGRIDVGWHYNNATGTSDGDGGGNFELYSANSSVAGAQGDFRVVFGGNASIGAMRLYHYDATHPTTQWKNRFAQLANGYVGISTNDAEGILTPTALLDVRASSNDYANAATIQIYNSSANQSASATLRVQQSTSAVSLWVANTVNYIGTQGAQAFNLATNNAIRATFQANGHVNVNTTVAVSGYTSFGNTVTFNPGTVVGTNETATNAGMMWNANTATALLLTDGAFFRNLLRYDSSTKDIWIGHGSTSWIDDIIIAAGSTTPGASVVLRSGSVVGVTVNTTQTSVLTDFSVTGNTVIAGTANVQGQFAVANSTSTNFVVTPVANAVNYIQVAGGGTPTISAQGSDAYVTLNINAKSAPIIFSSRSTGRSLMLADSGAPGANYLQITGYASGTSPSLAAQGSDANVDINVITKGTGSHIFQTGTTSATQVKILDSAGANRFIELRGGVSGTNSPAVGAAGGTTFGLYSTGGGNINFFTDGYEGTRQFAVSHTAGATNYGQITGSTGSSAVILSAQGANTNIAFTVASKGSGDVNISGGTGGWISFNAGGVRQVAVKYTASAINYLTMNGGAAGSDPTLDLTYGSDADIGINILTKGAGVVKSTGPVQVETDTVITTKTLTTTTTTANQIIATFAAATYRSAEFIIQATDATGTKYQKTKMLAVHNGTTAEYVEYGNVNVGGDCGTFDVSYSSGIQLRVTPASTNSTVFKVTCILTKV